MAVVLIAFLLGSFATVIEKKLGSADGSSAWDEGSKKIRSTGAAPPGRSSVTVVSSSTGVPAGEAGGFPPVKVDLVNGAVVWYTAEQEFEDQPGKAPAVG